MKKRDWIDIALRYSILLIIGIIGNQFFYSIFSYITIQPVFLLLSIFYNPALISSVIVINSLPLEIIGACVAGSAYYLLLILNLSVPNIKFLKRVYILLFSFALLLIVNILRIFLLSVLYVNQWPFFDITHELFWYAGSILFVVGIWFLSVYLFKIKEIPFYSDIKNILGLRRKRKK